MEAVMISAEISAHGTTAVHLLRFISSSKPWPSSRTPREVRVARPWNTVLALVWIIEMSSPSFDRNMSYVGPLNVIVPEQLSSSRCNTSRRGVDTRSRQRAERAAHRIGTLGHAV